MNRRARVLGALTVVAGVPLGLLTTAGAESTAIPFADARLKVELNATDGDAGLQVFVDAEPWNLIRIYNPDGVKILDMQATGTIRDYGLTELFSESSEPPFDEFPLAEFKELFPEGAYRFSGRTIDGRMLVGEAMLTHDFPKGPNILQPEDGEIVPGDSVVVEWEPVVGPPGTVVAGYQVVVTTDSGPLRVFEADLPASATELPIPAEFFQPGLYKAEVLAIEVGGNQTLTEHEFTVE
jgi:hypothetical protein